MRLPQRFLALLLLSLPSLATLAGCSRDVDRVVTNERLLRGPGSLGTTSSTTPPADRDTYVGTGTANFGVTLLAGQSGALEARAFVRPLTWSLPDTTLSGFAVDSIVFTANREPLADPGITTMTATLGTIATPWDSVGTSWPGPPVDVPLGSKIYDFVGALRIPLATSLFASIKQWAASPLQAPGFVLGGSGNIGAFVADSVMFRIHYSYLSGTEPKQGLATTRAVQNFYLHAPLSPLPTGGESALLLGGPYGTAVPVRVPVPPIAPGNSLNEASVVLTVTGLGQPIPGGRFLPTVYLDVSVARILEPWAESVTDTSEIAVSVPLSLLRLHKFEPGVDTEITLPVPLTWALAWGADSTSNHGVLVLFTGWYEQQQVTATTTAYIAHGTDVAPPLLIGSRESASPAVLRLTQTTPPPGRF